MIKYPTGSVAWNELDEAGKYAMWSDHINAGGAPFSYPAFCDLLDEMTSLFVSGA